MKRKGDGNTYSCRIVPRGSEMMKDRAWLPSLRVKITQENDQIKAIKDSLKCWHLGDRHSSLGANKIQFISIKLFPAFESRKRRRMSFNIRLKEKLDWGRTKRQVKTSGGIKALMAQNLDQKEKGNWRGVIVKVWKLKQT